MKKILLLVALFTLVVAGNVEAQQRASVHFFMTNHTYKTNDLVSKDGIIYRAKTTTSNTPPHADWEEIGSGTDYFFDSPLTLNTITNHVTLPKADANTDGYLSSSDWSKFNNKLDDYAEIDPIFIASPAYHTTGVNTGDQDLDPFETKHERIFQTTNFTTSAAQVGKKIIMSGNTLTLNPNGLTIGYQNDILNNSGGDIIIDTGTYSQSTIQPSIPPIADGKYAYIEYIATNTWSVIVGGDSGSPEPVSYTFNTPLNESNGNVTFDDTDFAKTNRTNWFHNDTYMNNQFYLFKDINNTSGQYYSVRHAGYDVEVQTNSSLYINRYGYGVNIKNLYSDFAEIKVPKTTMEISDYDIANGKTLVTKEWVLNQGYDSPPDLSPYETKAGRQLTVSSDFTTEPSHVGMKILLTGSKIILDDTGLTPGYQVTILNRSGGTVSIDYTTHTQNIIQSVSDLANGKYAYFELISDNTWSAVIGTDGTTGGGATTLGELTDVDISGVGDQQVLSFDQTNAKWIPMTIGGGVTTIGGLSDVQNLNPANRHALLWNSTTNQYENRLLTEADISDLGPYNNYSHPLGNGNYHLPSGGNIGQVVVNTAPGTGTWQNAVLTDDQTASEVSFSSTEFNADNVRDAIIENKASINTLDGELDNKVGSISYNTTKHSIDTDNNYSAVIPLVGIQNGLMTPALYQNVLSNNSKVSNATHTGEVTGSYSLTIASDVVDSDNIKDGTIDEVDMKITNNFSSDSFLTYSPGNGFQWAVPSGQGTTYTAGNGLTLSGSEFSHADTSNQPSVEQSGNVVIQDISLDTLGHITSIGTKEITLSGLGYVAPNTYDGWKLMVDNTDRGTIAENETVNLVAGNNTSIAYSTSNNTITISSSDQYTGTIDNISSNDFDTSISSGTATINLKTNIVSTNHIINGTIAPEDLDAAGNTPQNHYVLEYNTDLHNEPVFQWVPQTTSTGDITSVTTTGPLNGGSASGDVNLSITKADATHDGYLSSTDWNTFNNKGDITGVTAGTGLSGGTQSGNATLNWDPYQVTETSFYAGSYLFWDTDDNKGPFKTTINNIPISYFNDNVDIQGMAHNLSFGDGFGYTTESNPTGWGTNYTIWINTGNGLKTDINTHKLELGTLTADWNAGSNYSITAKSFFEASDRRLKENIERLDDRYVSFNFKADKTKRKHYGVIAQELEKTMPELVREDEKGYKSVNYIELLVKEIVDLRAQNKALEQRIEALEKKMK